jgi:hypothetical protein
MRQHLEFLLGLFDEDESPSVAAEDWDGERGAVLRSSQEAGLIAKAPGANPAAGCPHCEDGTPYRVGRRLLCDRCRCEIDLRHLLQWRVDLPAFLRWIAIGLHLHGDVRRIDDALWQLGTWKSPQGVHECFYRRCVSISEAGSARLSAYRQAVVLFGRAQPQEEKCDGHHHLSLVELVSADPPLQLREPTSLLRPRDDLLFDVDPGTLWAGGTSLGEVPLGSKEYFFLRCLASNIDRYVSYADLKREVLGRSGSADTRDEASFCHRLKSRIKSRFIHEIDRFLVTTNKGDGYRLVGRGGA